MDVLDRFFNKTFFEKKKFSFRFYLHHHKKTATNKNELLLYKSIVKDNSVCFMKKNV